MSNGGRAALLSLLLKRKITSNLRLAPHTVGLTEQRRMSHRHDSLLHFLTEATVKGFFDTIDTEAKMGESVDWPKKVATFGLFNEYRQWSKDTRINSFDVLSMTMFVEKIREYGFNASGMRECTVPPLKALQRTIDLKQGTHKGELE
jgi:hypothetical protein